MSMIYDFLILQEENNITLFEFYINPGNGIWNKPTKIIGKHNSSNNDIELSFMNKVIHSGNTLKESIGGYISHHSKKIGALVGSAIVATAISSGSPVEANSGMSIGGTPVNAAIFSASGNDSAYKGTKALAGIKDAIASAVSDHNKIIAKSDLGKNAPYEADDIKIIFIIDDKKGKASNKTVDEIAKRTDSLLWSNLMNRAINGKDDDKINAFATSNIKASSPVKNHQIVYMSIPSSMMDIAMDSEKESSALSAVVKSTIVHELTHAQYGYGETEAVKVQAQIGKSINASTQIAAIVANEGALMHQKRAAFFSNAFNNEYFLSAMTSHSSVHHKDIKMCSNILSDSFKKMSENTVLTQENIGYFASILTKDRVDMQKKFGANLNEYGGALYPAVDFKSAHFTVDNPEAVTCGHIQAMVNILKENKVEDSSIRNFTNAFIESGEAYNMATYTNKGQFFNDPLEKTMGSYGIGSKASIEKAMKEIVEIEIAHKNKEVMKNTSLSNQKNDISLSHTEEMNYSRRLKI